MGFCSSLVRFHALHFTITWCIITSSFREKRKSGATPRPGRRLRPLHSHYLVQPYLIFLGKEKERGLPAPQAGSSSRREGVELAVGAPNVEYAMRDRCPTAEERIIVSCIMPVGEERLP
jgi:hypothetical protein